MELRILKTEQELELAFPIIKNLRPQLDWESFVTLTEKARLCDQYTLVGLMDGENCLGVMGFRILYDFVHGQHLYVDDLVIHEAHRSRGYGAELLRFADKVAYESGCKIMRLCTGLDNQGGKKFYEKEGWALRSVVYKKDITPPTLFCAPTATA
jgi:ribosomal protein S18 acetylase RimI-like enzyme